MIGIMCVKIVLAKFHFQALTPFGTILIKYDIMLKIIIVYLQKKQRNYMFDSIEAIRSKCAKYYKVDLHVHSPLSFDWKNHSTPTYNRNPLLDETGVKGKISKKQLEAFVNELEKAGLDIAAITDHMKWSFGVALANYVRKKNRDIVILPGIELHVRINKPVLSECRIHVLAIFPPDIGSNIEKIFPLDFKSESKRNGKDDELLIDNIDDLIKKVRDLGGKTILSRIDGNNGLQCAYTKDASLILKPLSENQEKAWKQFHRDTGDTLNNLIYKFDCLQVTETADPVHFKNSFDKLSSPLIMASNAHHIKEFGNKNKIAYIKMKEKNISSLYEAFAFPVTRIRFKENLPEVKPPRIRGIRIIGQQNGDKTLFKNTTVGFSDNLTCIVGPRGSGKSTLIDAIRYAMGYNRSLDEIKQVKDQILDRQANTLQASKIELLYEKSDGVLHKITSTYDSREPYNTKIYDTGDNELDIKDVEACGKYPLNLYGWNELELSGGDPRSQRENLDKLINGVARLKYEKKRLCESLVSNSNQCLAQLDILEAFFDPSSQETSFTRVKEFKSEFDKLNPGGVDEKFKKLDEIVQNIYLLSHLKKGISSIDKELTNLSGIDYQSVLVKHGDNIWCKDFIQDKLKINNVNDEIIKKKEEMTGSISALVQILEQEEVNLRNDKNEISKEIRASIGEKESITAELRTNAKKRYYTANEQFEAYKRDLEIFEKYLAERKGIIEKIKGTNQKIFAARKKGIDEIRAKISIVTDPGFNIDLVLFHEKDKIDFLSELENNNIGIKHDGEWNRKKTPNLIADKLNPFAFADALHNNLPEELIHNITFSDNNIDYSCSLDKKYAKKLTEDNFPYETLQDIGVRRYDRDRMQTIFSIQNIPFDDEFYVELNGKPIKNCSPGQRCSAMLPIVALTSDAPIIIDQPEDNLDNRLVSKAIFRILSKLKETRQIIVATHNPNILVSGDTEQAVVLRDTGEIEKFGSIDEPSIIKNVVELMEGGKEAFERRKNKYIDHV
jgi:ABC-type lipoprotein export system ATPase subunit